MRFIFTLEQRDFFRKHRFIEFEGLLASEHIAYLNQKTEEIIEQRLQLPLSKWDAISLYKAGYDLWRNDDAIKKATQKLSIVHIASELFETSPLRLAFDQLCIAGSPSPYKGALSLSEISSIKPLAGGILFLLEDFEPHQSLKFPLPRVAGNALFIAPELPIPWPELFSIPRLRILLLAFAPEKSFYRPEPNDPHSPAFKKWGYVYNDPLKATLHPIVFGRK
jgi:hypothetical protein